MSYIGKSDLPATANLSPDARLYAGTGWLPLVREALAIIGSSEILSIREDAGALRIELANSTPEQRAAMSEIAQRSLTVCEICGEQGQLRFEGLKDGHPAGWHRVRCEAHSNTRTSDIEKKHTPVTIEQMNEITAAGWAGQLDELTHGDELTAREKRRRQAFWQMSPQRASEELSEVLAELRVILAADKSNPIGTAASWSIDQLREAVPVHTDAKPRYVRPGEIPEPWRTRFEIASAFSTRSARGHYAEDWLYFLERWQKEHSELLERLADQGSHKPSWDSFFDLPKADPDYLPADRGTRADTEVRLGIADFFLKTVRGTAAAQKTFKALAPQFSGKYPHHKMLTDLLIEQEYLPVETEMNPLLIIDFEATCDKESQPGYRYEIIEIGACWVSPSGEVLDTFETLVCADQKLSEFCIEYLGITQAEVDGGASFPEAAAALAEFANRYPAKTWGSWGEGDLKMLARDSTHHGVKNPLEGWAHRNLKLEYHTAKPKQKKNKRHVGMKRALIELDIPLDGAHHRALADALNIAKVFAERVRRESWKTDFKARDDAKFAANMVLMEIEKLDIEYPDPAPEAGE